MARFAAAGNSSRMRRPVALDTLGDFPVGVVAPGAVEGCMLAFILHQLPGLRPVAGQTNILGLALQ